jgi:SAM-dependent methyltransferase
LCARQAKLYGELASWWPLILPPAEYAEEAEFCRRVLVEKCRRPLHTLLELGCGGGNNASHLKQHFKLTLVDWSAEMLKVSSALNPECEHIQGDMRTLRMTRLFDAVLIHDSIMHMTTEPELFAALQTAFEHCAHGGAALFVPDNVRENFCPITAHGGTDRDGRGARCVWWIWDPDPNDTTYEMTMAYALRDAHGSVKFEGDNHQLGIFPRQTWLKLLKEVGFDANMVTADPNREVFTGVRLQSQTDTH